MYGMWNLWFADSVCWILFTVAPCFGIKMASPDFDGYCNHYITFMLFYGIFLNVFLFFTLYWQGLKALRKKKAFAFAPQWYQFRKRSEDMMHWLDNIEKVVAELPDSANQPRVKVKINAFISAIWSSQFWSHLNLYGQNISTLLTKGNHITKHHENIFTAVS